MKHQAAIAVDGFVHIHPGPQGSDHDGHLVLHAHFQVVLQPVIGLVHNLVDREGGGRLVRVGLVPGIQLFGNALEPHFQFFRRAGIQRRKRANNAGFALGNDQIRVGNNEHGRCHNGQLQAVLQGGR